MNNVLLATAEVLEKAAAYIEELERTKIAEQQAVSYKAASKLAQQVSYATGEPVSTELVEKLSATSPDIRDLISKIASDDLVDSMGGPQFETKTASVVQGIGSAEASLMSWLQT